MEVVHDNESARVDSLHSHEEIIHIAGFVSCKLKFLCELFLVLLICVIIVVRLSYFADVSTLDRICGGRISSVIDDPAMV